jgi:hypothetical protein
LWFLRRQWELPRVSCTLAAAGNYPVVFPQSHQHYTEIQPEFDLEGLPTLKGVKTPPLCVSSEMSILLPESWSPGLNANSHIMRAEFLRKRK